MRLQVRTTSLQQRSPDRLPGIWRSAFISGDAAFSAQSAPNRWISRVGKSIGEKKILRETGRVAKQGVIHRGNFAALFSSPGFVARRAECGVRQSAFFPQIRPNGSRDQNGPNLDVQWEYCRVSKHERGQCRLDLKPRERPAS